MKDQLASSLVAAAATVFITVLVAWLQEIVQDRNRQNARHRSLTHVRDEIAAIEAWSNASTALALDRESDDLRYRVRRDLDAAYEKLRNVLDEDHARPTAVRVVASRLLLRHIPTQGWSRFVRSAYYISLCMFVVWAFAWIGEQKSWTDPAELTGSVIAYLILAVLPAWLLARLTIRLSRSTLVRSFDP